MNNGVGHGKTPSTAVLLRPYAIAGAVAMCIAGGAWAGNPGPNMTTIPSTDQDFSIVISEPPDGSEIPSPPGTVQVMGQVSIGAVAGNPANLLYIIDVSNSTVAPAGQDCDGDGNPNQPGDNFNGDLTVGDTLDCEISGIIALNESLFNTVNVDAGVVVFGENAVVADVGPAAGQQNFASPLNLDAQPNGTPDIEEVVRSLDQGSVGVFTAANVGTDTDFDDAITAVNTAFASQPAGETNIAFFLSDGVSMLATGAGSPLQAAADAGTAIHTFSVGGASTGCGAGAELRTIADATGGTCTEVSDPSDLVTALPGLTPALLDRVEVNDVVVPTDAIGNFTATVPCPDSESDTPFNVTATAFADSTTISADIDLTCKAPNSAPVAVADVDAGDEGNETTPSVPVVGNVLANDTDANNPPGDLTVTTTGVFAGAYGTLTLHVNGSYSYVIDDANPAVDGLNLGDSVVDPFNYTISDNDPADPKTSSSTLTITVNGTNDAPVAAPDVGAGNEGNETTPSVPVVGNVLANDTDVDNAPADFTVTTAGVFAGMYGTLTLNPDGGYSYVINDASPVVNALNVGDSLAEVLNYTMSDNAPGGAKTSSSTLTITIYGTNDAPLANAGADQSAQCTGPGTLVALNGSGSSDPDSNPLAYQWTNSFGAANGVAPTVSLPPGMHNIQLLVDDLQGKTDSHSVKVTIADTAKPSLTAALVKMSGTKSKEDWWAWASSSYSSGVKYKVSLQCSDACDADPTIEANVNGMPVSDGDILSLPLPGTGKYGKRESPDPVLEAICSDSSGNKAVATYTLPPEDLCRIKLGDSYVDRLKQQSFGAMQHLYTMTGCTTVGPYRHVYTFTKTGP